MLQIKCWIGYSVGFFNKLTTYPRRLRCPWGSSTFIRNMNIYICQMNRGKYSCLRWTRSRRKQRMTLLTERPVMHALHLSVVVVEVFPGFWQNVAGECLSEHTKNTTKTDDFFKVFMHAKSKLWISDHAGAKMMWWFDRSKCNLPTKPVDGDI